jgi:ribosomal protein L32E
MAKRKFLRSAWRNYSKLGRKKKLRYKKATGRDSKIRLKMKGHITNVSIGHKTQKNERGLIKGSKPIMIYCLEDLKKLGKKEIGIVAKIGNKNKIEIAKYALEKKIYLLNLNPNKFLEKENERIKEREKEKLEIDEKKKKREKRAKETEKKKDEVKKEDNIKEENKIDENTEEENKEDKK